MPLVTDPWLQVKVSGKPRISAAPGCLLYGSEIPLYIQRRPYLQDQIFHTIRTEIRDFLIDWHRIASKIPRRLSLRCHDIEPRYLLHA